MVSYPTICEIGEVAIKTRRRRRRRWRIISIPNVLSNIALAEVDVIVGVAETVIPPYWVGDMITGRRQWLPWAPVTWALWVVIWAARPGI
jgi:hypothetical protein